MLAQPAIQRQIDEAAFAVVHNKSFPGFKALNQKALYNELMPDPAQVFKMTGVRITYSSISPCTFKSCTRRWVRTVDSAAGCKKGYAKTVKKQSCRAERPTEEARLTFKRVTTLNVTAFRKLPIESSPKAKKADDERMQSQCKPGAELECETKPLSACESDTIDFSNNSFQVREKCNDPLNRNQPSDDIMDCDWTKFSDEITVDQNWESNFNSKLKNIPKNFCNNRSHAYKKDQRKAETSAVNRSSSRCSQGQKGVNPSSNEVGCGSQKDTRTILSPIRESAETGEYPKEHATLSDNCSCKSLRSNEMNFVKRQKSGPHGRPINHRNMIENEMDTTELNDNSIQTRENCNDSPNQDQSLNDTTDYEWTKCTDEIIVDRNWEPNFNSTLKNSHKHSDNNRSHASQKDQRITEISAVNRSSSRCSQSQNRVNSSLNEVGYGSRKETQTIVSPIRESAETDEYPSERATPSDNCSYKSLWSNEMDFKQLLKIGPDSRQVEYCNVIENDSEICHNNYIEDVSMPHMSFDSHEESWSMGFPECESRNRLEDESMPRMDYDTSFSSNGSEYYEERMSDSKNTDIQ